MYSQHHRLPHKRQHKISRTTKEIETVVISTITVKITTIQIIDEIAVSREVDTITSNGLVHDQDNFVQIGIISSDTDRRLEIIVIIIRNVVLIIEVKIAGIVRIEVSRLEPRKCKTGITH